jgi:glycosyltransferase involved in cell wall biosynthesis
LALVNLFKKERPDIVHSHTAKAGWLSMLAAKFAGVKTRIYSPSESSLISSKHKPNLLHQKMEQITFELATDIWIDSLGLKSLILDRGLCTMEKLHIHHRGSSNGIDISKFNRNILQENHLVAATMRIMPGEDDFIILSVGRLVRDKGIEELVTAFLNSKIVDKSKLVLLGAFEQDLDPISPETVQTIRENPRIIQIDWSDHVAHYLALADILVHPSHREGFPNVILEAGAMHVPVICSDIIGNTDIITQQKTGLIFPVKDAAVLKEAMEFAFVKRDKMAEYAASLYEEVVQNYDRKFVQKEIFSNYQRLINASKTTE